MSIELYNRLWTEFEDKEYRDSYSSALVDSTVAMQLKVLREQRELTQTALAQLADMRQSRISEMEDVNYASWSVNTLKRLASAFDCHLEIRFVPFSEAISWGAFGEASKLRVPPFAIEKVRREKITDITPKGTADTIQLTTPRNTARRLGTMAKASLAYAPSRSTMTADQVLLGTK